MNWEDVPALLDRLADLWPGYRPRPGQRQMARAVAHAVEVGPESAGRGRHRRRQVPGLPPARRAQRARRRQAHAHRHLAQAVAGPVEQQGPPARRCAGARPGLPRPRLDHAQGHANYVCLVAADSRARCAEPHPLLDRVADWLRAGGHHGEFDELPFPVPGDLRARLSTEAEECPHERCPRYHDCFAMAAWRRAKAAPSSSPTTRCWRCRPPPKATSCRGRSTPSSSMRRTPSRTPPRAPTASSARRSPCAGCSTTTRADLLRQAEAALAPHCSDAPGVALDGLDR